MLLDMDSFEQSLISNMGSFDLDLSAETVTLLGDYYSLLTRWNDRLHLVAPCSPEEFAVRHVLESLLLLNHLPTNARVADIGNHVTVSLEHDELGSMHVERWVREHVIGHIPGSRHAPPE